MRPATALGVSFHPVTGGGVVFSARDQQLYALDQASGLCWLSLDAPDAEREAVTLLRQATGVDTATAAGWFQSCLAQFRGLGLLQGSERPAEDVAPPAPSAIPPGPSRPVPHPVSGFCCRLPGVDILVRVSAGLRDRLAGMLSATLVPGLARVDAVLDIVRTEAGFSARSDGVPLGEAAREAGLAVMVETILVNLAVHRTPHLAALHAALVARDGRGLLLSGESGAGKSTLVTALLSQGWDYGTDELVMLTADRLVPMPIAPCIKEGSQAEASRRFPALALEPAQDRYGRRVRYLPLRRPALAGATADCVVFPRWDAAATPGLTRLAPIEGLTRLLAQCIRVSGRMDAAGVDRLLAWHAGLRYVAITYAGSDQATALLEQALAG
ncbi:MAG TPA: hypothetical protein VGM87_17780 [Roseomonas sp.]|jgi:hypothetical protein